MRGPPHLLLTSHILPSCSAITILLRCCCRGLLRCSFGLLRLLGLLRTASRFGSGGASLGCL